MKVQIDIDPKGVSTAEAFELLLSTLDMRFVMDEDTDYEIREDEGVKEVWAKNASHHEYHLYDDRGELFVALRNVAVNLYPDLFFRSDSYIYK